MPGSDTYQRIYAVVRRIPKGRVATYGQIAELAELPGHARQVGYALNALHDEKAVPWHRVINAKGEISIRNFDGASDEQHSRLEAEGIVFDDHDRVPLKKYQWKPRPRK